MLKRTILILSFISSCIILLSFIPREKNHQKNVRTIIVDAGHGIMENGGHNGAKGSYSYEDEICLAVSKQLVARLKTEMPEIKVIESRPTERIVPLHRRAEIANENKGDLFLCIHVNAAGPIRHSELTGYKTVTSYVGKGKKRKKVTRKVPQYRRWTTPNPASGTETYIWGAHKNDDKEVAMRENAPMLEE
ncbi:MAG: N-acetylmuramoyl-L-alanine amidase, partial [Bacteroidota bacterium]